MFIRLIKFNKGKTIQQTHDEKLGIKNCLTTLLRAVLPESGIIPLTNETDADDVNWASSPRAAEADCYLPLARDMITNLEVLTDCHEYRWLQQGLKRTEPKIIITLCLALLMQ